MTNADAGLRAGLWLQAGIWAWTSCIVVAWFTRHGGGVWHELPGYMALVAATVRIAFGFVGPAALRFNGFALPARDLIEYTKNLLRRRGRSDSRSPFEEYLTFSLLGLTVLTGISGWLLTTDRYWGRGWIDTAHGLFAVALVILALCRAISILTRSFRSTPG